MDNNTSENKLFYIILLAFSLGALLIGQIWTEKEDNKAKNYVKIPKDLPISTSTNKKDNNGTGGPLFKTIDLLKNKKQPYSPPKNIYDKNMYKKEVIPVAFKGFFDILELRIKGDITDNSTQFLSLNIGSISGVYGSKRAKLNRLDLKNSTSFQDKIKLTINLKENNVLSQTKEEFDKNPVGYKVVDFYDNAFYPPLPNPTAINFLVAPFNKNGVYGKNVAIQKLEIRYACSKETPDCKVSICPKSETCKNKCELIKKSLDQKSCHAYQSYFKSN